ncbi:phosphoenolpyruvate carboxykinase (ATP), partial [Candidatus Acetothermia bacterium]
MDFHTHVESLLNRPTVFQNPTRRFMIAESVRRREAIILSTGALATWTPPESTGRSPLDTLTVRRKESEKNIDWDSPNNIPIDEETFDMVFADAIATLKGKDQIYVTDRVLGADPGYALPVRTITASPLSALFTDNMFRPVPDGIEESIFADRPFTLLVLPYDKLDPKRYEGRLRIDPRIGG